MRRRPTTKSCVCLEARLMRVFAKETDEEAAMPKQPVRDIVLAASLTLSMAACASSETTQSWYEGLDGAVQSGYNDGASVNAFIPGSATELSWDDREALGRSDEFVGLHAGNQFAADFFRQLDQHVALDPGIDQFPDQRALRRRQGLEQQRCLRRMHGIQHAIGAAQAAGGERSLDGGEPRTAVAARRCGFAHRGSALWRTSNCG